MQPRLPIGHKVPQCPPPTSPSPGWRNHIGSGGKRSSEFWAQLRLTEACQPHQKPDTPALCPQPLPTCPPAQPDSTVTPAAASKAARPSPPGPLAHQACAPLAKPTWGPRPLHIATPALRGALQEWGGSEGGQRGRELALLLLVNAPRAGAKNRGGEIFRQSQDAFGRRRERGREGAGGGEERGREGGEEEDLSFQIHALRASEGQPWVWDPGQAWLWEQWAQPHGDSRTPQLARPGRTQAEAKINAHRADRERPVGGPNTYPHLATQRASVHAGPGAQAGPTAGPPWPPNLMGSYGEARMLPAAQ